jgi:Tfp pilus assembly protein PilO
MSLAANAGMGTPMRDDVPSSTGLVYVLKRLGVLGLMGLGMLAVAAWLHWSAVPAQREAAAQLASDVRQARHALMAITAAKADAPMQASIDKPDQAWQVLVDGLPDQTQRTKLQSAVLASAKAQGLVVQSVKWRGAAEAWSASPKLWRQRMQIPVEGRYTAVRQWVDTLLQQRALSLDAIELQRGDLMTDQVKAQVSLSLWWRVAPKGP